MTTDQLSGNEHPGNASDSGAQLTAGTTLRKERIRRGLSEKDVADRLHITMHYVRSIETDKYEKLPGDVFAKGYLKRYSELLELDTDEIISAYQSIEAGRKEEQAEAVRQLVQHRKDKNKPWVILSVLVFCGGFTALWAFYNSIEEPINTVELTATELAQGARANQTAQIAEALPEPALQPAQVTDSNAPQLDFAEATNANANLSEENPDSETISREAGLQAESALEDTLLSAEDTTEDTIERSLSDTAIAADEDLQVDDASASAQEAARPGDISVQQASDGRRIIEIGNNGDDVLQITFSGESWVEVNDGDANQIYRDIREAGDVLEITGTAPFNILLGDAPFTHLTFNGSEIDVSDDIRIDNSARLTVGL